MRPGFLVLLSLATVAAADGGWERLSDRDGMVVERRALENTPLQEVRVTTRSTLPPASIMATLWKHEDYVQFVPYLKRLDVLRDEGDVKLIYQQARIPLAKDRDSTVRVRRTFAPDTGVWELVSTAVPEEGPAPTSEYVRVQHSEARWRLEPSADGGTALTYTLRTDAGGLLPAWVVNVAQREITAKLVRAVLDRAAHANPSLRATPSSGP
jgi:hypothetical protein